MLPLLFFFLLVCFGRFFFFCWFCVMIVCYDCYEEVKRNGPHVLCFFLFAHCGQQGKKKTHITLFSG